MSDLMIWDFRVTNRRGAEGAEQKTIFLDELSATLRLYGKNSFTVSRISRF